MNQIKHNGVVYTASSLARKIIGRAGINKRNLRMLKSASICDPACGDGSILAEVVKTLCQLPAKDAKAALGRISGFDIDKAALIACRKNLDEVVSKRMNGWKCRWNLRLIDATSKKFAASHANHFTHVVGNPPYVRVQNLEKERRSAITKNWTLAHGATDLFIIFFELGFEILQQGGTLCYITPSSWTKSKAGEGLRERMLENYRVLGLIDFGQRQMFEGVTTYTSICAVKKERGRNGVIPVSMEDDPQKKRRGVVEIDSANPRAPWLALDKKASERMNIIRKRGPALKYVADINVGIQTLADRIFILPVKKADARPGYVEVETPDGRSVLIEKSATRPIIKASVAKHGKDIKNRVVIFPYDKSAVLIPEEELKRAAPCAYQWLVCNKQILLARDKGKIEKEKWYGFGRAVCIKNGFGRKIITSGINKSPNFQICTNPGATFYSGYAIKPKQGVCMENLLKELNSERMRFFINNTSRPYQGGWRSYAKSFIENFPVSKELLPRGAP